MAFSKFSIILLMVLSIISCSTTTQTDLRVAANDNLQLGLAYLQQNQSEEAYQKLQLASRQAPAAAEVWVALAYFYQKIHRWGLAQPMYQKALAIKPNAGGILNNYAVFCCQRGDFMMAQQYFHKALADSHYLYPQKIYLNQAICAKMAGNLSQERLALQNTLKVDPQEGLARQMLDELDFNS